MEFLEINNLWLVLSLLGVVGAVTAFLNDRLDKIRGFLAHLDDRLGQFIKVYETLEDIVSDGIDESEVEAGARWLAARLKARFGKPAQ